MNIIKTKFICFFAFLAFFLPIISFADNNKGYIKILTISDIHFNPFYACEKTKSSCPIIKLLMRKNINDWETLFQTYDKKIPDYKEDNGYILFKASLNKFNEIIKKDKISFVILAGDFASHDLKKQFFKYNAKATTKEFELFAAKVFSFVSLKLKHALTPINSYIAIGNNDTFGEHYTITNKFYKKIGPQWASLISNKNKQQQMHRSFIKHGYYAIDEGKDNNLKLIFLNSTIFSPYYIAKSNEVSEQLDWLEKTTKVAVRKNQKIIFITHIPIGIDVYNTIENRKVSPFWSSHPSSKFYTLLKNFNSSIIAILAGHIHADWFQSLHFENNNLLTTSIPAISPQFGNHPAFKIYKLNLNTNKLEDYQVYFYPLGQNNSKWQLEYQFSATYPANNILNGINLINKNGIYAELYKKYYSISTNSQPITNDAWLPYYWCALHEILPENYSSCVRA